MKKFKNKNLTYRAAVLLVGVITFSACSSDEEVVNVNPSFDGESVKTQFAINIPHAAQTKTRMTCDNTQADGSGFLGMQDIRLIPFSGTIDGTTSFDQVITLSNIDRDVITGTASNKIYKNVAIPTGTTNFLFYGQALRNNDATNKDNGILTTTVDGQTSTADITFKLNDVNTTGSTTNANSNALLEVLNAVASVNGWSSSTNAKLQQLYKDFTNSQAGSANSILCTMQALYDNLKDNNDDVSNAIKTAITQNGTFTNTDGTLSTTNKYPGDLNLPDGAVAVEFNKNNDNKFTYVTPTSDAATSDPIIDVNNITYPASLYYWTSTPLYASNTDVSTWPQTPSAWETDNAFDGWGTEVTSSTQSVALKNNINYGVGNLALTVTCAESTLQDHEKTQENGPTSQRNVNVPTDGFPVSAVLIGNQPNVVGYDFAAASNDLFTKTIYDSECKLAAKYNAVSDASYTLVLPTKNMEKQVVRFVLELTNTSDTEFCGHNQQIIPKNGKFYLVGTLNVNADQGVEKPNDSVTEVFISDYLTKAKVTIKSLKEAYNVIPDLRSTNLQLGLSVDLEWKTGITFDVTIE